jgi:DNA polymerase-3 subunit chi
MSNGTPAAARPEGKVLFYHLTRSGLEETLALLMGRAAGQGWRVMLRGTDRARLQVLDERLWSQGGGAEFLAHGMDGGPHDALQPALLGTGALPEGIDGLFLIEGARTTADEARSLRRVWVLFDGGDEGQLAGARALWAELTAAGLAAQYWAEDEGRWTLKQERPAAGAGA